MSVFVLLAGFMTLAAIAVILWPMLRKPASGRRWPAAAIAAVIVPLLAVTLYVSLSNWVWDPDERPQAGVPEEIERMVSSLEARLRGNPTDVEGWLLLGRSYFQLERFFKAADAFQQAYTLTQGRNVDAIIGLGESLAFADQSMLLGRSADLFEQAYALSPDHPKVLWYSGLIAYQGGQRAVARERWARLVALDPPAEVKRILQSKVEEIEAELGGSAPGSVSAAGKPAEATPDSEGATGAPVVKVRVALAPKLAAQAPSDAPLFVLVRSAEGAGPPLAVTRRMSGELPLLVQLTERDAMIAGRGLGTSGQVTVVARIARSGAPTASSGDLEGRVSYDLSHSNVVDLVIDTIVP